MSNQHQPLSVYKSFIVAIIFLIISLSIGACLDLNETTSSDTDVTPTQHVTSQGSNKTTSTLPPTATHKPAPTPKPLRWTNTHTWNGNGEKITDNFSISGSLWKIKYTCHGNSTYGSTGMFSVFIRNEDGSSAEDGPDTDGCKATDAGSSDETTIHLSETFYLKIIATDDWSIAVQEKK